MPKLVHPNLPGQLVDVPDQTATVLARSGWGPATTDSLTGRTRAELDELAVERGLDPSDYSTKADLADALTAEA